jgi:hypothetical protein
MSGMSRVKGVGMCSVDVRTGRIVRVGGISG